METKMMLQTMMILEINHKRPKSRGFTLFELIVVLLIISAMLTIVIPYATRSNKSLKAKQECLNMATAIMYAIDLAADTKRPTRILIDSKDRSYLLEMSSGIGNCNFTPIKDPQGSVHYFGETISIVDIDGFDIAAGAHCLTFDPTSPWPDASLSFSIGETINTIRIRGKQVEINESTTW